MHLLKNTRLVLILLLSALLAAACTQGSPSPTPAADIPTAEQSEPPTAPPTAQATPRPSQIDSPVPDSDDAEVVLSTFTIHTGEPFASGVQLAAWTPQTYGGVDVALPADLAQIDNPQVLAGLAAEQRNFLAQNGFVIVHSQEPQFDDLRKSLLDQGQPYYLTTDAALHALHLDFDELLKALERAELRPGMAAMVEAALNEVLAYLPQTQGASLEGDTLLAASYLAVALKLFDPSAGVDPRLEAAVQAQIDQIMAYGGRDESVLIPGFEDDYGAYRPVGHYAGDEDLESYFRGMTWLGRVHFRLLPKEGLPEPSRAPLIATYALRRAEVGGQPAADAWADIHEALTFVIGPSDDATPPEYAALMDQVYGPDHTLASLADDALWAEFQSRYKDLPAPQIHSTFLASTSEMAEDVGWRFMGQRFTIDGYILNYLIFDSVQPRPDESRRNLPVGPDVMAVLGSPVALDAVEAAGEADYPNYLDQVALLQQEVLSRPQEEWLLRFYDAWLYAFFPLLAPKDAAYPSYMQTRAWAFKEMNTALGSWAELKHDTILYSKMPEGRGGGGPPTSPPQPAYVEPNPEAFYRMAYMARLLVEGLKQRGMAGELSMGGDPARQGGSVFGKAHGESGAVQYDYDPKLEDLIGRLGQYADILQQLGDIAARELAGEPLTEDDRRFILKSCLAFTECQNRYDDQPPDPLPIVAAVAGGGDSVLEAATGFVDRLYVLAPLDSGGITVAQGGVFSYYEFRQPRTDRLTDEAWRERLSGPDAPPLPAWASKFILPGGQPTNAVAFRIGDTYFVTEAGDLVNVRENPAIAAASLVQLERGMYFDIIEGPVDADGYRWWKIQIYSYEQNGGTEGWIVEDPTWYSRSS